MDLSLVGLKTLRLQIPRHEMTLKEVVSKNGAFRSGNSKYLNPKLNKISLKCQTSVASTVIILINSRCVVELHKKNND